ncbi:toll-like receptor 4 [Haliotis rubra]|uniref:toll-like receptor 4 n=1 Tax=Haliotis rubra TaxID=36100 RepID=UPI001EE55042|nr:toll-like receptor 4 [Haliotis rubra]
MNTIFLMVFTLAHEVLTLTYNTGDETDSCKRLCHCWHDNSSYGGDMYIADCSDRGISSLTEQLALPTNTNVILLGRNNISKLGNDDFRKYSNLTYLELSSNTISIVEERSFEQLYQLVFLSLEKNHITLRLLSQNPKLFQDLANLKVLKLNGNFIKIGSDDVSSVEMKTINTYPDVFHWLLSLDTLFIDGITNATFGSGFSKLTNLTKLIMSGDNGQCAIGNLHNASFERVPYLTYLDISKCSLTDIEAGTFAHTPNLQTLNISSNTRLGFAKLGKAFYGLQSSNISVLAANRIVRMHPKCVVIRQEDVQYLKSTSLTHLYIDDNTIMNIDRGVLRLLPRTLRFISAQRHRFDFGAYVYEVKYLTGLKYLRLSGVNVPIDEPIRNMLEMQLSDEVVAGAVDDSDDNIIHSMPWDYEIQPYIYPYTTKPVLVVTNLTLPPNLEKVHSNFTQLTSKLASIRIQAESLQHVDLSSNLLQFREGTLLGYDNVTFLDLSNNVARWLSRDLFQQCASLEVLNMSHNFFKWDIYKDTDGQIFRNLFRLKQLHIASNGLMFVRGRIFRDLTSLEILNLSRNDIFDFSPELKNLKKLKQIDLSNNSIKWLMPDVREQLRTLKSVSPNLTLDLSWNPLLCSCRNVETLTWLLESGVTPDNMYGYFCLRFNEVRVITNKDDFEDLIRDLENKCFSAVSLICGTSVLIVFFFIVVIVGLLRRYRWKLRYLYHSARIQYKGNQNTPDDAHFMHDAFVSYADEDRGVVVNDMLYYMEIHDRINLNIHHRDFMPGEPIAANIICAIKNSRKTLVVLSQNFLNSYWCMYELRMAQMESISSGRDILIIIMYENIPTKDIPPEILKLLHTDSYIAYPTDEEDREEFWRCLCQAVRPQ